MVTKMFKKLKQAFKKLFDFANDDAKGISFLEQDLFAKASEKINEKTSKNGFDGYTIDPKEFHKLYKTGKISDEQSLTDDILKQLNPKYEPRGTQQAKSNRPDVIYEQLPSQPKKLTEQELFDQAFKKINEKSPNKLDTYFINKNQFHELYMQGKITDEQSLTDDVLRELNPDYKPQAKSNPAAQWTDNRGNHQKLPDFNSPQNHNALSSNSHGVIYSELPNRSPNIPQGQKANQVQDNLRQKVNSREQQESLYKPHGTQQATRPGQSNNVNHGKLPPPPSSVISSDAQYSAPSNPNGQNKGNSR